ncbi:hypothetical protein IWW50_005332 [Coemansia erecta]|nr:hypothetical protein GGF43_003023 [Coemansia sp. RSA 2618]KAJ2819779.1 hypothetical protein IWW50_005332 [Coemansia erecta]
MAGSSAAEFSPQQQTLMSLMENDEGEGHKASIMSMEKRRRRRESHNAVERRRRDNINDRITDLYGLLPTDLVDASAKPNKGIILRKAVEFITFIKEENATLQHQVAVLSARVHELESGISPSAIGHHQPSQAPSGQLSALFANSANINTSRPQGGDVNMMSSGL